MKRIFYLVAVLVSIAFLAGCKKGYNQKEKIYYGEKQRLGNGTVRSYVVLDEKGNPLSVGFNFTEKALIGLPSGEDTESMTMLDLPPQGAGTGYKHLEMNWNPGGHEPLAIYGLPHFDFHFYLVGMAELMQIVPGPDMTPVLPQYIPKDYESMVFAVPNMGVHWYDVFSPEFNGKTFDKTLIYGFYQGKMLFVEPMITLAFLKTKPNVTANIKQPAAFQNHAWYPKKYRVAYDPSSREYFVSIEELVRH